MRVVALISGGKDSNYNVMQCVAAGHEIVALANLQPRSKDELDSYMYQTVGHQGISLYAEAMGLPLFREETNGVAHHHHKWYTPTEGDEVEDLYRLLARVKNELDIEGVSSGAVLSDYQRLRVENVCTRLGLVSLAYLWRRDQSELLQEMIDGGLEAVVIKVAALGLDPSKHLGMRLQEIQPHLLKMNQKYGLNVCGEGGEYETFTLDCPFFSKRIVVDDYETVIHADDAFAPVGYLNFKKLSLVDKSELSPYQGLSNLISNVKGPLEYVSDLELPDEQLANIASEGETMRNDESDSSSCNSIVSSNICSRCDTSVFKNSSPKICINNSGWLWIGSLIGNNSNPELALSEALTKMRDLLTLKQYSVEDLVSITMFVRDMSQYSKLNSIYTSIIDKNNAPVRICLETNLPDESTVLMEALAHKSINSSPSNNERRAMHVQSISHWAPANIGPYSQAIKVGEIVYVAGQIALVPGTMQMVDGGICQECRLALRHVGRVISGIDQNSLLRDVVQAICYVTSHEFIRPARREWEKRSNNAIVDYVVVPALPRNAKIEWQVWAHRGNARFQYEETGCRIDKRHKAFSRKRFNYENSVSAVVCYLILDNGASIEGDIALEMDEMETLQQEHIENFINYTLSKLNGGEPPPEDSACSFKIFYPVSQQLVSQYVHNVLSNCSSSSPIAYSMVPVMQLHNVSTVLSICAVRHN